MNPNPNTAAHRVGDTVHITALDSARWAGTYEVTKVNPTTYRLKSPTVGNLKAHHSMVHAGPAPLPAVAAATAPSVDVIPMSSLKPGTPVRFTRGITTDRDRIYVVTGTAPRGVRLFPLGGSNRYHTNVPPAMLEIVTEIDGWRADS